MAVGSTVHTPQVNLARKWRSKTFDEIVGQDLSVKMLKNSLYLNHFFPVYLFAGQKGCGKTTTARVFAAALNCEQLPLFQKSPKSVVVPCLTCASCLAMSAGKHPDFIEIDAASNTGVDNVRNIIDAAAMLPVLGRKKIYLIDEAHMLSKAAFNAFLKLLEEPPVSVVFMLATTDTQKIIETVRSRCFQLFFKGIDAVQLIPHLKTICAAESINYEDAGLEKIVQETAGCARDALNLLEQVRFSHNTITETAVSQVLGFLEDMYIIELYTLAYTKQYPLLLTRLKELNVTSFSAEYMWQKMVALVRALMWIKCGVKPVSFESYYHELQSLAQAHSWHTLQSIAKLFADHEAIFYRSSIQHVVIEMMLLRLVSTVHTSTIEQSFSDTDIPHYESPSRKAKDEPLVVPQQAVVQSVSTSKELETSSVSSGSKGWSLFLHDIGQINDPLVSSIFSQAHVVSHDVHGQLMLRLPKELAFFNDWLDNTKSLWLPILQQHYGSEVKLALAFDGASESSDAEARSQELKKKVDNVGGDLNAVQKRPVSNEAKTSSNYVQKNYAQERRVRQTAYQQVGSSLDISDVERWKKTHLLLRHFPGIVREIQES